MNKQLRNEKGITLVELLAVLVIGGIVMVLIMGIFSNGQKQYSSQTAKAEQLNDVRYVAKVITKEIRKADKVKSINNVLELGKDSPIIFKQENNKILKNGITLMSKVSIFSVNRVTPNNRNLKITIVSTDANGKKQDIKTEIYIRDGVTIE
ncbi:prepilin-type N-terminal cleavage/methylation domain-containing protein [Planococcus sp. N064]|uniref:Prepilin-type N-terminal cleavage/methylation domain-containing protein n=1 Tax=Planococcus liqunii TaxID=3058394 RepID=A0ABT8MQI0_9BACL|nr:prepilin-type N-terminal cleavage/methylation domain-containing protein [Planococcus sp. N064]MDN7227020.1 prepilin-type N-terminal cleavage/methylation domain-containing protein [Planococcus sp. N064]